MAASQSSISERQPHLAPERALLSGWKEIANYLGKGVRTVQRYERELRLPVRRPAGRLKAAVVVTRAELEEWISRRPTSSNAAARLIAQPVHELQNAVSELRRLHAERRELLSSLRAQREALESNARRIGQALSQPVLAAAEEHRKIAVEQKARAVEMGESARAMVDQAVEMRRAPRRRLLLSC